MNNIFDSSLPPEKKPDEVSIVCVIDRSGSMSSIKKSTDTNFKEFINAQREVGPAEITLIEFDDQIDVVWDKADLHSVGDYSLEPRGMTALRDAIGIACTTNVSHERVIVLIITDGEDNRSVEYSPSQIQELVKRKEDDGWEFLFMGANIDAITSGKGLGISSGTRSVNYVADEKGIKDAFDMASTYMATSRILGKDIGDEYLTNHSKNPKNE